MASLNELPVLLDTNFVLSCYRFGILLEEIEKIIDEAHQVVVPCNVLEELEQLHLKGRDREAQKIMLEILKQYPVLPLHGKVDTSLLEYARTHECIICTNDRDLRKKLRKIGRRSIVVKARTHLGVE